jgi:hypothetical protein
MRVTGPQPNHAIAPDLRQIQHNSVVNTPASPLGCELPSCNVRSPSPLNFSLLAVRQPQFLVNFSERSIQLCRPLLRQVSAPGTPILPSLIIYPRRILDTIDLEYPTWSSRKPDSSVHLRLPGIYLHAAQSPGGCAAPLVCTTRPRGLDLSMATTYDKALRKDGQIH